MHNHNSEILRVPRLTAAEPEPVVVCGRCIVQCHQAVVTMAVGCLVKPNWKEEQKQPKATYCPALSTILLLNLQHYHVAAWSG